jgi:glucose/arabinose dehydrogenase
VLCFVVVISLASPYPIGPQLAAMKPLPRSAAPFLGLAVLLAACGDPSPTPEPAASRASVAPASAAAPSEPAGSIEPTEPASSASAPAIADDPGTIALEVVAEGLASPIGFATGPDGTLLVHEQGGRIVSLDPATSEQSVFLDLSDRILAGGEQGLLGLALHPEWPAVAMAFVHYTGPDGNTVISRVGISDLPSPPRLDPATEQVLLRVDQPFANHNGGQLAFGPDGMLYLGLGDGGSGGDPLGHGQDTATLLGSILRIDVVGAADGEPYAIPADNPFADGGGAPEIHLFGLRNPWRFSFDPATGLLWIADVGQSAWEEINRVDPVGDAGANLGWNLMEGAHCFADPACSTEGLQPPIAEYGRDAGCSVTGGEVYRGSGIPSLWGWYVFSDYCSGTLFGVPSDAEPPGDGTALAPRVLLETETNVSAFGVDGAGELYLADIEDGIVYRIVGG